MTTTFDALQKLIAEHRKQLGESDYRILKDFIEVVHNLQHLENNHRMDSLVEERISGMPWEKRFWDLRKPNYKIKQ